MTPHSRTARSSVVSVRVGRLRGFVAAALAPHVTPDPDRLRERADAEVFKETASSLVFAVCLGGRTVLVKRHRKKRLLPRLLTLFRRSRAERAYSIALALRGAGIRVPDPLGALEARQCGVVARSYFLVEFVAGAESLDRLLRRMPAGAASRLAIARRLGRLIGRIHGAGFRARDLKAPNFLVGPGCRVWLADLDGVTRQSPRLVHRRRGRDLARLVRDVAAAGPLDPAEGRAFVRGYRRGARQAVAAAGGDSAG